MEGEEGMLPSRPQKQEFSHFIGIRITWENSLERQDSRTPSPPSKVLSRGGAVMLGREELMDST
jgi:hypothetical protein